MELAIPIIRNDKVYNAVEIDEPDTDVIAKAYEYAQKGLIFKAIYEFVAGCIESISGDEMVTEKKQIKRICGMMPYVSAEVIALEVLILMHENDYIEGVYPCPRCGDEVITGNDGITDTRDRIKDLERVKMEGLETSIFVELKKSVKIKNTRTGEILEEIFSFEIRHPTLNDFVLAENGQTNDVIIQSRAYCNALQKVNGKDIDTTWKSKFGMLLMRKSKATSKFVITQEMKKYGIQKNKERTCMRCSKVWEAPVNTSNFFVSGLQPT